MFGQGAFQQYQDATPEQLERNRALLASMMPRYGRARYVGEGLGHLASGVVQGLVGRRMNEAESEGRSGATDLFERIVGSASGGTESPFVTSSPSYNSAAPVASSGRNSTGVGESAFNAGNTTGLPNMLPSESTVAGDPRRAILGNGAEVVDDPTVYTTRVTDLLGADPAVGDLVGNSIEQALGPGAAFEVTSGLRSGDIGSQHSVGGALDGRILAPNGDHVRWDDPRMSDVARVAASDGARGIGFGPTYMGGDYVHIDDGRGGATAHTRPGLVTWSDDDGGAADRGPGAAAIQGELAAISQGRSPAESVAGATPSQPSGTTYSAPVVSTQSQGSASIADLQAALANPWMSAEQRAVLTGMLNQQLREQDPLRQLQIQRAQMEIAQMQAGGGNEPTARMQNYQWALSQGFSHEEAMGFAGAGGTTVNVNGDEAGPNIGSIPQGYSAVIDPSDPSGYRLEPIPGGPGEVEAAEAQREADEAEDAEAAAAVQAAQALDQIMAVRNSPELAGITGIVQGRIPARTQAQQDLMVRIDQLQGQAFLQAFETLKGGGQITEREGAAATAAIARLDRSQSLEAYQDALDELAAIMSRGVARLEGQEVPEFGEAPGQVAAAEVQTPTAASTPTSVSTPSQSVGDAPEMPDTFSLTREQWEMAWARMTPDQRAQIIDRLGLQ